MKKLYLWLNHVLILGGVAALLTYMFLAFYPFKVLTVKSASVNNPIPAGQDLPVVSVGGVLTYSVDYCRYSDKGASVNRLLFNDTTAIPYPPATSVPKTGCRVVSVPLPISPITPPGVYKLRVSTTTKVNALREITTNFETNSFRVL